VVAPSRRPAGHRDDDLARFVQALESSKGACRQLPRRGQGLVDVGEHRAHAARLELASGLTRTARPTRAPRRG